MAYEKLTTPKSFVFDLALTSVFFLVMTEMLTPFAVGDNPSQFVRYMQAAFCATPIAGVFFIALEMFRVTLTDQLRRKQDLAQASHEG
ncbi:MAG: hypothetical protein ACFCU4_01525 [Puniceicoccaceae bacterium]